MGADVKLNFPIFGQQIYPRSFELKNGGRLQ